MADRRVVATAARTAESLGCPTAVYWAGMTVARLAVVRAKSMGICSAATLGEAMAARWVDSLAVALVPHEAGHWVDRWVVHWAAGRVGSSDIRWVAWRVLPTGLH